MVTQDLLRYVEYQLDRGVDKNSIKMTLLQAGWTGSDIDEAFTVVLAVQESPAPSLTTDQQQPTKVKSLTQPSITNANTTTVSQEPILINDTVLVSEGTTKAGMVDTTADSLSNSATDNPPTVGNNVDQVEFKSSLNNLEKQLAQSGYGQSTSQLSDQSKTDASNTLLPSHGPVKSNLNSINISNNTQPKNSSAVINPKNLTPQELNKTSEVAESNVAVELAAKSNLEALPKVGDTSQTIVKDLKYQNASAWQSQPADDSIIGDKTVTAEPVQPSMATVVNPGVYPATTGGQVLRPKIGSTNPFDPQTTTLSTASATDNMMAVNPAKALKDRQQRRSSYKQKGRLIPRLLIAIAVLGIITAGYYGFNYYQESTKLLSVAPLVANLSSQSNVLYTITGELPAPADTTDQPALFSDNQTLPVSIQGLIEPLIGNHGFSATFNSVKFAYVYFAKQSYGKLQQLPASVASSYEGVLDNWYEITDGSETQSLLRLASNNPTDSLRIMGQSLVSALSDLNQQQLLSIEEIEKIGNVSKYGVSIDASLLTARLASDGQVISDIIQTYNIRQLDLVVTVLDSTIQAIDVTVVTPSQQTKLLVTLNYNYNGTPVSVPPDTVSISTILPSLQALTQGGEVGDLENRFRLLGSDASVYVNNQDSYSGFCASEEVNRVGKYVGDTYGLTTTCSAAADTFAYKAILSQPEYTLCVDMSYLAKITDTASDTNPNACGTVTEYRIATQSVINNDEDSINGNEIDATATSGTQTNNNQGFFNL